MDALEYAAAGARPTSMRRHWYLAWIFGACDAPIHLESVDVSIESTDPRGIPVERLVEIGQRVTGLSFEYSAEVRGRFVRPPASRRVARETWFAWFQQALYHADLACVRRGKIIDIIDMRPGLRSPCHSPDPVRAFVTEASLEDHRDREGTRIMTLFRLQRLDRKEAIDLLDGRFRVSAGPWDGRGQLVLRGDGPEVYRASRFLRAWDR